MKMNKVELKRITVICVLCFLLMDTTIGQSASATTDATKRTNTQQIQEPHARNIKDENMHLKQDAGLLNKSNSDIINPSVNRIQNKSNGNSTLHHKHPDNISQEVKAPNWNISFASEANGGASVINTSSSDTSGQFNTTKTNKNENKSSYQSEISGRHQQVAPSVGNRLNQIGNESHISEIDKKPLSNLIMSTTMSTIHRQLESTLSSIPSGRENEQQSPSLSSKSHVSIYEADYDGKNIDEDNDMDIASDNLIKSTSQNKNRNKFDSDTNTKTDSSIKTNTDNQNGDTRPLLSSVNTGITNDSSSNPAQYKYLYYNYYLNVTGITSTTLKPPKNDIPQDVSVHQDTTQTNDTSVENGNNDTGNDEQGGGTIGILNALNLTSDSVNSNVSVQNDSTEQDTLNDISLDSLSEETDDEYTGNWYYKPSEYDNDNTDYEDYKYGDEYYYDDYYDDEYDDSDNSIDSIIGMTEKDSDEGDDTRFLQRMVSSSQHEKVVESGGFVHGYDTHIGNMHQAFHQTGSIEGPYGQHSFFKENSIGLMVFYVWIAVVAVIFIIGAVAFRQRHKINNVMWDIRTGYRKSTRRSPTEEVHQLINHEEPPV